MDDDEATSSSEPGADGPHHRVVLELGALDKSDTEEALRRIVRRSAETMGVARVNWWSIQHEPPAIRCEEAYDLRSSTYQRGAVLRESDYPRYFRALKDEKLIAADDARTDARTSEFTEGYLAPLGIGAMLDVPVWLGGALAGVLCHEWVGGSHEWSPSEQDFATSMGQLIATTLEVRERRRAEESLRVVEGSAQAAREAVQARDEFLAVASHELYTPLSSLQLAIDALRSTRLSEEDSQRSLALVDRQVKRLTHLVSTLLDVSRVQSGRLELVPEDIDLVELVRDVAERFDTVADTKVDATAPIIGRWDRGRIDQVFTNLFANAVKFARGRPVVSVRIRRQDNTAYVEVRDRGIGIPSERIPRVFERFGRAVSIRSYGGLGLGLFIVRNIVEAHGGRVSATSVVGEGTTIHVELPCEPVEAGP